MDNLSRFKKLLGGLGKRLYHLREAKEKMNFLSYMYETIIEEYADIHNGDYANAMDHLVELIKPMSEEVISKLILDVKVAGVPFKSFITKNLEDLPYIIETALFAIFGKWAKKVFLKPALIPASESPEKVTTIVLLMNECPFCSYTTISPEKLGAHKYGKFLCITVEQMLQAVQDYIENKYTVVGRETKCFLSGDSQGEMRFWLYPNDNLNLMDQNRYIKEIK